ncbi:MAG: LytTR family DNA-binding domain-containing protein [Oscillospiraceae bacterium]
MDIEIKLDPEYKLPKVIVLTDSVTDEVNAIVSKLSEDTPRIIAGFRDDMLRIIEPDEIKRVYSSGGKVYAETDDGEYTLRQRLYEMEERLDNSRFVRISNSEIINLQKVRCFDMNLVGTICVSFTDSGTTYVSRRYVTKIKKILGV